VILIKIDARLDAFEHRVLGISITKEQGLGMQTQGRTPKLCHWRWNLSKKQKFTRPAKRIGFICLSHTIGT